MIAERVADAMNQGVSVIVPRNQLVPSAWHDRFDQRRWFSMLSHGLPCGLPCCLRPMSIHTYNKSKITRYQHRPGYGARRPVKPLRHPVLVCVVRDRKFSHNAHFLHSRSRWTGTPRRSLFE